MNLKYHFHIALMTVLDLLIRPKLRERQAVENARRAADDRGWKTEEPWRINRRMHIYIGGMKLTGSDDDISFSVNGRSGDVLHLIRYDPRRLERDFAWSMATCPDAKYRNGNQALQFATAACELTQ